MTVARRRPAEEASTRGPEANLSLDHAKSIQKQRLYREWGVASVRGVARIKIEGRPRRSVVDPAARLWLGRGREAGPRPTPARPAAPAGPKVGVAYER